MIPFSPRSSRDISQDDVWKQGPVYTASNKPLARLVARPVREFLRIEAAGSILLLAAAALALIWANSPLSEGYFDLWHTKVGFQVGSFGIEEDLQHWVNDALMVIFFFVVGLEIKYELVRGDLRDPKTAALPIIAAVGGMVVPALLYLAIAGGGESGSGWGIPMATDIAFAVGVLGVLGRRIPSPARLFLLTLAIVDDIGAIIVIAVFYTEDLDLRWLAAALVLLLLIVGMRLLRIWSISAYVVVGFAAWFCTLESGVHATLAGVAIGLMTPAHALLNEGVAREYAQKAIADRSLDPDELDRLRFLLGESVPIVERLQNRLHPVSAYLVLPVFALANAGVDLRGGVLGEAVTSAVGLGVGAGLVIGKPVGILIACFVAVRFGIGRLPDRTSWGQIAGIGSIAGIGFTVSLFIAQLSFPGSEILTEDAKVGIILASLVAAIVGIGLLLVTPASPAAEVDAHDDTHDDDDDADGVDQDTSADSNVPHPQ